MIMNIYPDSFPVKRNYEIDRWNSELAYTFGLWILLIHNLVLDSVQIKRKLSFRILRSGFVFSPPKPKPKAKSTGP